jgi:hypothetical protein
VHRCTHKDIHEHHDVMVLVRKLIDAPDQVQMLTRKSAGALEYRSSAEHGKGPCQDRILQYDIHMSFRDIGPHGMSQGHRDVNLVAPWKGLEGPKYASLHITSISR